ncbi:hypothetical protein ACFXDH_08925 [Streptomyces sp. NPDC059467]|uniref:hypothetical protein n=1 Tax=Streptomyces sp. NPDC059467 TaxID=3346844 RepID=UPI0036904D8F
MAAGWCTRTVRAALFAAVCVLLAALAHTMMSAAPVPWWALGAGAVGAGGVGWALAGRERGLRVIVPMVVAAQGVLHWSFSFAQAAGHPAAGAGTMDMGSMDGHSMTMDMHSMGMDHSVHLGSGAPAFLEEWLGGTSMTGMYAAHLVAALVCGLWLGYGERVVFRLMRAVAGWLAAPLRLVLALPALPRRPRALVRRRRTHRGPRRLHLVHAITSRGPPHTFAV